MAAESKHEDKSGTSPQPGLAVCTWAAASTLRHLNTTFNPVVSREGFVATYCPGDRAVRVWNGQLEPMQLFRDAPGMAGCLWAPTSRNGGSLSLLAAVPLSPHRKEPRVWNVHTGEEWTTDWTVPSHLKKPSKSRRGRKEKVPDPRDCFPFVAGAWSPDSTVLATCGKGGVLWHVGSNSEEGLRVVALLAGMDPSTLPEHVSNRDPVPQIRACAWNADGTILAGSAYRGTVLVWLRDGSLVHQLEGHSGPGDGHCVWGSGPRAHLLATCGGTDGQVKVWDTRTGKELPNRCPRIKLHPCTIKGCSWTADGRLLSWDVGARLKAWRVVDGCISLEHTLEAFPSCANRHYVELRPSDDGRLVIGTKWSIPSLLGVWDTATWERVAVPGPEAGVVGRARFDCVCAPFHNSKGGCGPPAYRLAVVGTDRTCWVGTIRLQGAVDARGSAGGATASTPTPAPTPTAPSAVRAGSLPASSPTPPHRDSDTACCQALRSEVARLRAQVAADKAAADAKLAAAAARVAGLERKLAQALSRSPAGDSEWLLAVGSAQAAVARLCTLRDQHAEAAAACPVADSVNPEAGDEVRLLPVVPGADTCPARVEGMKGASCGHAAGRGAAPGSKPSKSGLRGLCRFVTGRKR